MQQELRDQMGYIDLILMVFKGSETRYVFIIWGNLGLQKSLNEAPPFPTKH